MRTHVTQKLIPTLRTLHHYLPLIHKRSGYFRVITIIILLLLGGTYAAQIQSSDPIKLVHPHNTNQKVTSFAITETPHFKITRTKGTAKAHAQTSDVPIQLLDYHGNLVAIEPQILESNHTETILLSLPLSSEKNLPGKYTLVTSLGSGKEIKQDFTWGVLALNFEQSSYTTNEEAKIMMAVLDDRGKTMCNADIHLTIHDPFGRRQVKSSKEKSVHVSDICADKYVTNEPDYLATFTPELAGDYRVTVTATIPNGTRSLTQTIQVTNKPDFVIKRSNTSMRIYPAAIYEVTAEITAKQDFIGTITETIPNTFNIAEEKYDYSVTTDGNLKTLTWNNTQIKAGETKTITYKYDAPDISPEFYLLGPIELREAGVKTVFTEPRSWQIASDSACQSNVASSGNWNTTGSWINCAGVVPQAGDTVQIVNGDTITLNASSNNIESLTIDSGGIFTTSGTVTLNLNNTATSTPLTINGTFTATASTFTTAFIGNNSGGNTTIPAATYNILTLNNASETFDLTGSIAIRGNYTLTAGTVSGGSSTVTFFAPNNSSITISGSQTFNNLTFDRTSGISPAAITIASGTILTVSGVLTFDITSASGTSITLNTGTLDAKGDVVIADSLSYTGTASLTISDTDSQAFTSSQTLASGGILPITINKGGGTLTLSGTFRTSSNWTHTTGTVNSASATIVFTAPNNSTQTISGSHTLENVVIDRTNGASPATISLSSGTLTVNTSLIFDSTVSSGSSSVTINSGTLAAKGTITVADSASYDGSASLTINGTGNQVFTGNATQTSGGILPLTINKASGTLTFSGTIRTNQNWTYTAGTIDPSTSTVVFVSQNSSRTITGSHSLYNVTFDTNSSSYWLIQIESATTLTVNGTLTLDNSSTGQLGVRAGNISAKGDVIVADSVNYDDSTIITINGTEDQTLSGRATQTAGGFPNLVINKPSGTLYLAGTIRTGRDWTYTAGNVNSGTSTIIFVSAGSSRTITGSQSLYNVTFDSNSSGTVLIYIASGTTLTVNGTLKLDNSSTGLYGILTGAISAKGDFIIADTNTYSYSGTATITLNGVTNQTLTGSATATAGNIPTLIINKPAGTLYLAGTIRTDKNWTYTAGAIDAGTSTVVWTGSGTTQTITGSHTLYNVTHDANYAYSGMTLSIASGTTITTTGTLRFYNSTGFNNWGMTVNGGTFAVSGDLNIADNNNYAGTVTLLINGTGSQTFAGAASDTVGITPKVTIDKPSGTLNLSGTIRTDKDWTYTQGTIATGTSTLVFASNGTQIITGSHSLNNVKIYPNTPYGCCGYTIATGTTLTATGTLSIYNGQSNSYGLPINGDTIEAKGDIVTDVGPFAGTATLKITGTGNQTWTGSATSSEGSIPIVEINKPSGILTLSGTIRTTKNWTYTSGTVDATTNNSTLIIAGTMTLDGQGTSSTMTFDNLTLNTTSSTVTLGGALDIDGNYTNTTSTGSGLAAGSNTISVAGNWTNTGSSTSAITTSGTVTFDGSGNSTINTGGTNTGHDFQNVTIAKIGNGVVSLTGNTLDIDGNLVISSGTLSLAGQNVTTSTSFSNEGTLRLVGTETVAWTTNDTNSGTWEYAGDGDGLSDTIAIKTFTGADYYSLKINSTDSTTDTFTLPNGLDVDGDFTNTLGTAQPASSAALTIGGNWTNASAFTANGSTITFDAGATGKTITSNGTSGAFYSATFSNASGGWTLQDNTTVSNVLTVSSGILNGGSVTLTLSGTTGTPLSVSGTFTGETSTVAFTGNNDSGNTTIPALTTYNAITVNNASETYVLAGTTTLSGDLTITAGTFDVVSGQNYALNIGGNFTNSSTFEAQWGTVTFNAGSTGKTITTNGNWFYNLIFNNSSGEWTMQDSTTVANTLNVSAGNLSAGSTTLTLAGTTGTPLSALGTFTPASSTIVYTGNNSGGNTTVPAITYNNLTMNNALETYVLVGSTTTNGNVTITAGTLDTVSGQNYALNIGGSYANSGTFTARSGTVTFTATSGSKTLGGTLNGASTFYNLVFNGSGGAWSINADTLVSNDLTVTAGTVSGTSNITVNGGDITGAGTLNLTGGTLLVDGTGSYGGGTWAVNNLNFGDGSITSTTTATAGSTTVSGVATIATNQTLNAGSHTFRLAGTSGTPFVISGTFTPATSIIGFTGNNGSGNTTIPATTYASLLVHNGSETFVLSGPTIATYDLTITAGTLDTVSGQNYALTVGRNWSNSGTFTARSGTVTFNTSNDSTISGSTTFNNLTTTTAGKKLKFQKATTSTPVITIAGTFTATGAALNKVTIQSDTPGSQWLAHFNAAQSAITYANIQDSGCDTGTSNVTLNQTTFSAGNNGNCWSFSDTQNKIRLNGGARLKAGSRLQGI